MPLSYAFLDTKFFYDGNKAKLEPSMIKHDQLYDGFENGKGL